MNLTLVLSYATSKVLLNKSSKIGLPSPQSGLLSSTEYVLLVSVLSYTVNAIYVVFLNFLYDSNKSSLMSK